MQSDARALILQPRIQLAVLDRETERTGRVTEFGEMAWILNPEFWREPPLQAVQSRDRLHSAAKNAIRVCDSSSCQDGQRPCARKIAQSMIHAGIDAR